MLLALAMPLPAQAAPAAQEAGAKPAALNAEQLINDWVKRMNALDDWYISTGGNEETDGVLNSLMELYAPDAIQTVGPSEDQIGTVMLTGAAHIREWSHTFAQSFVQL